MTAQQLGSIVAKSFAIFAIFRAIGSAAYWTQGIYYWREGIQSTPFLQSHYFIDMIICAGYLFMAMVLWGNAHRFGLVKGEVAESASVESVPWSRLAFSVLGAFIALTYLGSVLTLILFLGTAPSDGRSTWVQYAPNVVAFLIGTVIWLVNAKGKEGIRSAANWLRPPD